MSKTYENTLWGQGYLQKGTGVFSKRDRGMYTYENGVVGSVGGMV